MKKNFQFNVLLLAVLASASFPAMALQPFSAQYEASYKGVSAGGAMSLSQQGVRWTYSMSISNAAATMSQATVFVETNGVFRPLGGSDRSQYLMQRKSVVTRYDWKNMQTRWTGDVKPTRAGPIKMQSGDMDALLVNLALARDAVAGKPMNYRLVENGKVKPVNYRIAGKETLSIAGKSITTTRVVQSTGGKQTTAWIAPGIPVPVRIVQREGGSEIFSLRIKSWR
ncbi:MAG: DUF3108 domain-containing protein [Pseudoxanthomonas sp.]